MIRILLIVLGVCLCVILNVSVSFCQCGPDGKQPCNSTPKKPVAKKPTVIHTPSRPVAKPVNHPPVRKPKTKPDDTPAGSEKTPAASANGVKAHVPLKEAVRFKYLGDVDTRKPDGTTDFDAKIQNYEKAIEIDPKYADAYLDLGMVYESKGDIDTAIIKFGKAIENDRSLIRAYLHRGDAYYRKREYESAITNFSQLLTLDPTNSYAYLNRGKARIGLNDREAAIDDFAKAILNDPSTTAQAVSSKAYLERADAYSFMKAYDDSISDLDEVLKRDSNNARASKLRDETLRPKKRFDDALRIRNKSVDERKDVSAYIDRGDLFRDNNRFEEAMADYNQAIQITEAAPKSEQPAPGPDPKILAYFGRGLTHYKKKEYDLALADLSQAIQLSSTKSYTVFYNRGLVYYAQKNYKNAIDDFTVVTVENAGYADAYKQRALAYYDQKEYISARDDLEMYIQLNHNQSAEGFLLRARVYDTLGDKAKADEDRNKAKELTKN